MPLCCSSSFSFFFLSLQKRNLDEKSCFFRAQSVEDVGWWEGEGREGGDRGEGEGEQSSVGALTGRGADRPRRGRVIEMCFYSGGEKKKGEKKKSCREKEKEKKKKKRERHAAAEIKRTGVS